MMYGVTRSRFRTANPVGIVAGRPLRFGNRQRNFLKSIGGPGSVPTAEDKLMEQVATSAVAQAEKSAAAAASGSLVPTDGGPGVSESMTAEAMADAGMMFPDLGGLFQDRRSSCYTAVSRSLLTSSCASRWPCWLPDRADPTAVERLRAGRDLRIPESDLGADPRRSLGVPRYLAGSSNGWIRRERRSGSHCFRRSTRLCGSPWRQLIQAQLTG